MNFRILNGFADAFWASLGCLKIFGFDYM